MASNSRTELEGGVMGLFVLISTTLLVCKQLSRHNNRNNDLWSSHSSPVLRNIECTCNIGNTCEFKWVATATLRSHHVEGLFPVINHTFLVYKQVSTQGTITSRSLNKLDVKNHCLAPSLHLGATAWGLRVF